MSFKEKFMAFFQKFKSKSNSKSSSNYRKSNNALIKIILLAVFSAILVSSIVIAAPKVETLIPSINYDLITTSPEIKRSYDFSATDTNIEKVKSDIKVIETKLHKLGYFNVEVSNISEENIEEVQTFKFNIKVQTSKDISYVDRIMSDRSSISFMTVKDGFDPSKTDNQIDAYLVDNYNSTQFNNSYFRNIQVQKLKDSSDEYSYFAMLKAYPRETKELDTFLKENNGKYIGINFGNYVVPRQIEGEQLKSLFLFLTKDDTEAKYYLTVLNSGVIQSNLEMVSQADETPKLLDFNMYILMGFLTSVAVLFAVVVYLRSRKDTLEAIKYLGGFLFTITIFISIYKIGGLQFAMWSFPISGVILAIVLYLKNAYVTLTYITILAIFGWLVVGIDNLLVTQSFFVITLGIIVSYMFEIYLNNLRKVLK
jgi:hypothetical protein